MSKSVVSAPLSTGALSTGTGTGTVGQRPVLVPRRHLSDRQAQTVQRLVDAAVEEVREVGYDGLTVRNVARRAGVAPATAYNYFASREHLVTEVFWRRLEELPDTELDFRRTPASRVAATVSQFARVVAGEPELAAAWTVAVLANDPDVKVLRDRIGLEWRRRLQRALGDHDDPVVLSTLEFSVSGAMLQAGMGHLSYDALPGELSRVAELVLR